MSTAKSLQKPIIIGVLGSVVRIAHPDTTNYVRTQLSDTINAAGTAMSVLDNNGFADDDWFIAGEPGDEKTEECDVNGVVTRGGSMTVTNTLKFAHEAQAPVTKILERAVRIYGAATDGGAGTLIASIDAITTPIADAYQIQWNKAYTEYTLITTDTAYAYYYAVFVDGAGTVSAASAYIPSTGIPSNMAESFIQDALDIADAKIDKTLTRKMLVSWVNDAQRAITQFSYKDSRTGEEMQMDWDFEMLSDESSITLSEGENSYALSSLTVQPKYPNSDKGIVNVRIGSRSILRKYNISDFDRRMTNKIRGTINGASSVGATTLTVVSNVEFAAAGTLYLGADTLTYTAKSGTTQFTGIPASGTGSITAISASGSAVWQNAQPGLPTFYTVFNGRVLLDKPVSSLYASFPLKIRYFKKLTDITSANDTTEVDFTNVFQTFLCAQIETRRGNLDKAAEYMKDFDQQLLDNALKSKIPTSDNQTYYDFIPHAPDVYVSNLSPSNLTDFL